MALGGILVPASPKAGSDLPPSPVALKENAEGVTVKNVSNQQIVHITLECFFTRGRTKFAIHSLLFQEVSLEPQMHIKLVDGATRQEMLEECRSRYPSYRPGIIVKRVIFADKTGWPPPPFIQGGWAENLRGTPLTLSTTPSGYIVLNNSKGTITDYTLGCIQVSDNHVRILRSYPSNHGVLEPGSSIQASAWDAPAPDIVQDCVLHRKKKMAVVEVKFQDGNIWQPTTKP